MGCGFSQANNNKQLLPTHHQGLQVLASGTHGKVYQTHYTVNDRECALKVIDNLSRDASIDFIEKQISTRFQKIHTLSPEFLVRYQSFSLNNEKLSIMMELSAEGTLQQKVTKGGRLPEQDVSIYTRQLLGGLLELHCAGLMHQDLKPTNVLLFEEKKVKISDYSIADVYDCRLRESRPKQIKVDHMKWNNIPYMAPEVVKNLGVTPSSDVWSLGCIVVFMLTGKRPWTELGSQEQLFNKVTKQSIPPLPFGITVACEHFLQCCLSVIPSQRSKVQELLEHPFITGAKEYQIPEKPPKGMKIKDISESQINPQQIKLKVQKDSSQVPRMKTEVDQKTKQNDKNHEFQRFTRFNTSEVIILDNNIIKIGEKPSEIKNSQKISFSSDKKKEEVDDSNHFVMLNNKKIKLKPSLYRNVRPRVCSTEEAEWTSPSRVKMTSVKEQRQRSSNPRDKTMQFQPSLGIHSGFSRYDDESINESRLRILTEPSMEEPGKDFFKKPLKLIKKKIQQKKAEVLFQEKMSNATRKFSVAEEIEKIKETKASNEVDQSDDYGSRLNNYEDIVIDTEVARAERNRFNVAKKIDEKRREERRVKWEFQLNKGRQILLEEPPFCSYLI